MSYASAKGKMAPASLKPLNRKPQPELSDDEKEVIAERIRLIKTHIPEAWEDLKKFNAAGMIDGYRCAVYARLLKREDHESDG